MNIAFKSTTLSLENTERRTILVAGGAGFLGSHLCDHLLHAGHKVICVDNFSTGRMENLWHLLRFDTFSFIRHDIISSFDVPVDEIYNLACPASPPHYQADPIHTMKTCVFGSLNLLELAARHQARIFQASTSEVYGDPQVHPQPESYWGNVNSFGPRSCYDEGKRSAETLFRDFHVRYGVDIRIARIFNTYGPRMRPDDGRVVSNFIVQALKGQDITVYGDGSQTRSFCYVDDLIKGFVRLMGDQSAIHTPVNLGNPVEFTVRELAEQIVTMTGSSSKIVYKTLPIDDPRQRRPDITVAKRELGWEPSVALTDGLKSTVSYFERQLVRPSGELVEVA
ncbi:MULTISPECIES: UDP-glucuronic acid decarboxylase family protein [Rhizobium]|jgi:UDP-glucuronate decarboxylase|uniref:UDP-glucuronate decarboxylase n=1 Tax=Rhizobium lusitanum TaxID=293958 RepID=A0A1C3V0T0_9HYPH|nr:MULTISPECIES: UDP-glucuronic acid decarboxylase family protein [Rhizobium]NKJ37849.1 UDP-glucuronate decarboxylase [Rhizobium sp. SG570]NRP87799.1 UDP-glucose 4-epimerase [Ensifer adhaerens]NTJ10351.1 SDR family oxidoreductase [Rhizobium lusitanum]SCB21285.1 UDP-glucuronate decarboxylase [Rhizobium lusitanum]